MRIVTILTTILLAIQLQAADLSFDDGPYADSGIDSANIQVGENAYWTQVTTTPEGLPVTARLTLKSSSDPLYTAVEFTTDQENDLRINVVRTTCTSHNPISCADNVVDLDFRLEFFEPESGLPAPLAFALLFQDLDKESADDYELFTFNKADLYSLTLENPTLLETASSDNALVVSSTGSLNPHSSVNSFLGNFNKIEYLDFNIQIGKYRKNSWFFIDGDSSSDYFSDPDTTIILPAEPAAPTIDSPANNAQFSNGTMIEITGTAECNDSVALFADDQLICTTIASLKGLWSCQTDALATGDHTLVAYASDEYLSHSLVSNSVDITISEDTGSDIDTNASSASTTTDSKADNPQLNTAVSGTGATDIWLAVFCPLLLWLARRTK